MKPAPLSSFLLATLASAVSATAPAASSTMTGFTASGAAEQRALEARFDAALDPADLRAWMQTLAAGPNHVGAPHNRENAEYVRDLFREWGWKAEIERFDVLYPTPKRTSLEMVAPTAFKAALAEPPVAGDASTAKPGALPPYNIYGADGDVTAELVYVNQGMPDDYAELARRGVEVKGKIVIARYGGGWRGLKPKLAYEHGAVGCLIYSDPKNDGYGVGETYPEGGWRPPEGVQRGSVADMPIYSGDPLTPGVGATKDAKRLPLAEAKTLLKIPVMPISYADAKPLLEALAGPVAPEAWRGALPITYRIGPGPARVHMTIESEWSLKTLYNVIAKIGGTEHPDEWIVRGNHRDGWTFGAWDPLSGHVAELAEAKAIGALLEGGWKPRRTIVYASWDGEEAGLLGSTEWAEAHANELRKKAVLYLNSDTNTRGFLQAGGSHSLQRFVNEVAADVPDPQTKVTVRERLRAQLRVAGYGEAKDEDRRKAAKVAGGGDIPLDALGSGSDFTPFMQHLGIASLDLSYGGEDDQGGVYHSLYDTFEHYLRFGDPDFAYGVAEAKTAGRTVLRMANAPVLPLEFGSFAAAVKEYRDELGKLVEDRRKNAAALAALLDSRAFELAADPTRPLGPPERIPEVATLDFAPLDAAIARLAKSAAAYDAARARVDAGTASLDARERTKLNALLQGLEQALTDPQGLPGREWYRHLIYAPGLLTGYGVKTLPGVREAAEDDRWDEANRYVGITAAALAAYCDRLDEATALLN
ncbi:MAG TPA: transferrin receptor-like dimerization domain-containing protein [Steroidobacteraceae bacterium]|nr:transferrin receptor-like dimerization domain-containing protein [Steroidobacteraceae bacterium]